MVYHEVRKLKGKLYNYLIYNIRDGKKWKKASRYIGEGAFPKSTIKKEIEKFKIELKKAEYLSKEQVLEIENIRKKFDSYLRKSGKIGIEKFDEWFFTELTYNSNAIEGNTLSLEDTSLIINENIAPKGASLREIYEAKNHKEAIEFLKGYKGELNERLILKIHSFILKNIADSFAGKYRRTEVRIRGTEFKPPYADAVPLLVTELVKWYKENKKKHGSGFGGRRHRIPVNIRRGCNERLDAKKHRDYRLLKNTYYTDFCQRCIAIPADKRKKRQVLSCYAADYYRLLGWLRYYVSLVFVTKGRRTSSPFN